ncbi:MAG: DUF4358 domain-containing protein [Clostridiales bacterium]|nr:DUF4358 domain-containing protein [Clostridiales bacterium]
MKTKLFTAAFLLSCVLLSGCSRPKIENTDIYNAAVSLARETELKDETVESLLDIDIAERYGLNPSDIEEGYVITSSEKGKPDKIIIAKGKDTAATENIEKSLSNVLINLTSSYKDYSEESKKNRKSPFQNKRHSYGFGCVQ